MVKLYTFHMFNKKVCLSSPRGSSFRIKTNLSFLTLSDTEISSLSFPKQQQQQQQLSRAKSSTTTSGRDRTLET